MPARAYKHQNGTHKIAYIGFPFTSNSQVMVSRIKQEALDGSIFTNLLLFFCRQLFSVCPKITLFILACLAALRLALKLNVIDVKLWPKNCKELKNSKTSFRFMLVLVKSKPELEVTGREQKWKWNGGSVTRLAIF